MEGPRVFLFLVLLFLFFASPNTSPPSLARQYELDQVVAEEIHDVSLSNSSTYGDFDPSTYRWLNLTGFRRNDNYAWDLLPHVKSKAREQRRRIFYAYHKAVQSPEDNHIGETGSNSNTGTQNSSVSVALGDHDDVYQNMTGFIRGKWVRWEPVVGYQGPKLNLSLLAPSTLYSKENFGHNVTGREGDMRFRLEEKRSESLISTHGYAREIKAEMTLKDESSTGDGWAIVLHGVHYPQRNTIILTSTSPKYAGIFALPHLAIWQRDFIPAKDLLGQTLTRTMIQQEQNGNNLNPWSASPQRPTELFAQIPHCEYIVYLQQHPLDRSETELRPVEEELRFPSGAPLPSVQPLTMSAMVFSPDCGFVLESKGPPDFAPQDGNHLTGPKLESELRLAKHTILAFLLTLCAEVFLLLRQMREASTPSTRSRISFYTIAMLAMGDGFTWIAFLTVALMVDALHLVALSVAFLAFLSVGFFGMKFLIDIWTIQAPERLEAARQTPANPTSEARTEPPAAVSGGPNESPGLPLPANARRPTDTGATPVILPPDQNLEAAEAEDTVQQTTPTTQGSVSRDMRAVFIRLYLTLAVVVILSLHATTWPTALRSLYTNALSFVYLSFWAPQIYRNTMRNSRRALKFEFVIGQSCLRLAPFAYFYTVSDNVLSVTADRNAAYVLIAWVWIQVWVLISQEILGPRFFIRSAWAPPAYDYHPVLREDDEESGARMPIGFTQATAGPSSPTSKPGGSSERGRRIFDCAICMQNLEVPVVPAGGDRNEGGTAAAASIFSRRNYMVTPCRHIFHSACLEGWLRYRLQCPICRENLPPL